VQTARRGNVLGIIGTVLAVLRHVLDIDRDMNAGLVSSRAGACAPSSPFGAHSCARVQLVAALLPSTVVGVLMGMYVVMTAMPQMVGLLNRSVTPSPEFAGRGR
jgi:NAD/NADP transhydrogenase beta subunit